MEQKRVSIYHTCTVQHVRELMPLLKIIMGNNLPQTELSVTEQGSIYFKNRVAWDLPINQQSPRNEGEARDAAEYWLTEARKREANAHNLFKNTQNKAESYLPLFFHTNWIFLKALPEYSDKNLLRYWKVIYSLKLTSIEGLPKGEARVVPDHQMCLYIKYKNPMLLPAIDYISRPIFKAEAVQSLLHFQEADIPNLRMIENAANHTISPYKMADDGNWVAMTEVGAEKPKPEQKKEWINGWLWFGVTEKISDNKTYLYKPDTDPKYILNLKRRENFMLLKTAYEHLKNGADTNLKGLISCIETQQENTFVLRCGFNHSEQAEKTDERVGIELVKVWLTTENKEVEDDYGSTTVCLGEVTLKKQARYYDKCTKKYIGSNSAAIIEMAHALGHFWEIYFLSREMRQASQFNIPIKGNGTLTNPDAYELPYISIKVDVIDAKTYSIKEYKFAEVVKNIPQSIKAYNEWLEKGYIVIGNNNTSFSTYEKTNLFSNEATLIEYLHTCYRSDFREWIATCVQNLFAKALSESETPYVSVNDTKVNNYNYGINDPSKNPYKCTYPLYNVTLHDNYRYRYDCTREDTQSPIIHIH